MMAWRNDGGLITTTLRPQLRIHGITSFQWLT
jgi:hypothetical protein